MLKTSRTVTADVLVIGGGGAACTAAVAAARAGASVVLVSKGKAGNSGNTIMIGGSYGMDGESAYYDYHIPGSDPSFTKESLFSSIVNDGFNLSDQNLVEQFVNDSPRIVYEVKEWGEEIGERFSFYAPSNWDVTGRSMGRALMNGVKKMENISVFNDIIVTDLLKNGDTVTGALGYDVYSGELIVFEAKATVLGTGGFSAYTLQNTNTDMTGDGLAMAYRAGAKLSDLEFQLFLMTAVEPYDIRGSILPALCTFRSKFDYDPVDRDGNHIEVPEKLREMEATSEMCKLVHMYYFGHVVNAGKGSPSGGIYFDFSRFTDEQIDEMFEAVMDHFDGFYKHGYYHGESIIDFRDLAKKKRRVEVGLTSEYSVGGIFVDENMFTGVPGLYAAGEAASGVFGANRVADAVTEMLVQGYKAGEVAAARASERTRVASDDAAIERAVGVLEKLLSNQGGIAVSEAIDRLGEISDKALGMVRNETALRAGVEAFETLGAEMDGISLRGKSLRYNRELMQALAARNLLACSRVAAKMALERRESRGLHLRDDYSYIDNENWQVRQLAELVNGEDKLSKKVPVVTRIPLRKAEKIDYESFILEEDLGMKNMEES